jgi:hypothetical protein
MFECGGEVGRGRRRRLEANADVIRLFRAHGDTRRANLDEEGRAAARYPHPAAVFEAELTKARGPRGVAVDSHDFALVSRLASRKRELGVSLVVW